MTLPQTKESMGSWASYFGPQLLHLLSVCHSALVLAVVATPNSGG